MGLNSPFDLLGLYRGVAIGHKSAGQIVERPRPHVPLSPAAARLLVRERRAVSPCASDDPRDRPPFRALRRGNGADREGCRMKKTISHDSRPQAPRRSAAERLRQCCDPSELGFRNNRGAHRPRPLPRPGARDRGCPVRHRHEARRLQPVAPTARPAPARRRWCGSHLQAHAGRHGPKPSDWAYVSNLSTPHKPHALALPGRAWRGPLRERHGKADAASCGSAIASAFERRRLPRAASRASREAVPQTRQEKTFGELQKTRQRARHRAGAHGRWVSPSRR